MVACKKQILIGSLLLFCSCATTTREKVLRDMALGTAAGVLLAQTKSNNKVGYSVVYGALGAAGAAVISTYFNVKNDDDLLRQNKELKEQVERFEKDLQPKLIQEGKSLFNSPLPKEVSSLVEPGEWKRYKLDQWVQDPNQSNTWYRQVEMFEIIPPVSK